MPFSEFDYCIICDGFRQEIGGKITILGFYNLAPHAEISIANPNAPVSLAFLAGFPPPEDAGSAQYMYSIRVNGPENRQIVQTPTMRLNVTPARRGFVGHVFPITPPYKFGLYSIQITVNGQVALDTSLRLRQATAGELAGMGIIPPSSGRPN